MFNNHETRETSHGTLKTCIQHRVSSIDKLINKFTNSPINFQNPPLHLSRELYKSTLFMQNEPNFKIHEILVSACNTDSYGNLIAFSHRKNEPKRTQNEPNFSSKLASFFPKLALFHNRIFAFAKNLNDLKPPRRLSWAKSAVKIIRAFWWLIFLLFKRPVKGVAYKDKLPRIIRLCIVIRLGQTKTVKQMSEKSLRFRKSM